MLTKTYTYWSALTPIILLIMLSTFLVELATLHIGDWMKLPVLAGVSILALHILLKGRIKAYRFFKNRTENIAKIRTSLTGGGLAESLAFDFQLSSNLDGIAERDKAFTNIIKGSGWAYTDFSYGIYRRARNGGEYKAATIHYSVVSLDLPRGLPNMLFDAKRSHGHQFILKFDASQRHKLEGNFDQYFDTYFPKNYSIDALSIITPEVMESMIRAAEYDIEIFGNKLYIFGPLQLPQNIDAMVAKGDSIRNKLMNNIVSYRDDRLEHTEGKAKVSVYGATLRPGTFSELSTLAMGIAMLAIGIMLGVNGGVYINEALLVGLVLTGVAIRNYWTVKSKNRQLDKEYALQRSIEEYKLGSKV